MPSEKRRACRFWVIVTESQEQILVVAALYLSMRSTAGGVQGIGSRSSRPSEMGSGFGLYRRD
jgi:hypothetical protein